MQAGSIGTTTGATLNVPYTSTVNKNDILLILVATKQNTTITTPDGWEFLSSGTNTGNTLTISWFHKTSTTGSESGNQSVTIGASGNTAGIMYRYSGSRGVIGTVQHSIINNSSALGTNSNAATGDLGCSFVVAAINEAVSASGGGFTQDDTKATSSAGGFSFCAASRVGDGTPSSNVVFNWTTNSAGALFTFFELND